MTFGDRCPVCLSEYLKPATVIEASGGYRVHCPACGRFALSEESWEDFLDPQTGQGSSIPKIKRALLSHMIRTAARGSDGTPKIDSDFVVRFLDDENTGPNPAEQASRIIEIVGDLISQTGEKIRSLAPDIYVLVGSPNPTFVGELAIELSERGLLTGQEFRVLGDTPPSLVDVGLTLAGWETYDNTKRGKFEGHYGFIAMKFGDSDLDKLLSETIKPKVKNGIGYNVVNMLDISRAGVIDNIMRAQIRDSAFVIVDLTHDNSGAYWEAGYAEGLGKPVIYICERTKFDAAKTHFDTNHCTTVTWSIEEPVAFSKELIATLRRSLDLFERQ